MNNYSDYFITAWVCVCVFFFFFGGHSEFWTRWEIWDRETVLRGAWDSLIFQNSSEDLIAERYLAISGDFSVPDLPPIDCKIQ